MLFYKSIYILTNIVFIFSIYKLFHAFFNENIYNTNIERLSYLLYFVFSSALIFVNEIPLVTLIFTISFLFIISFNYKSCFQKKIIVSSLIYAILFVIEIIVSVSIGLIDISAFQYNTFNSVIGLILMRTFTMIISYLLDRYLSIKKNNYSISAIYYLAFILILFGTLYLFAASLENDSLIIYNVIISGTILIIVNVTIIIIDEKIYNSIILSNEKNILIQQNKAYENEIYYINQSNESIKAFRHDIKNHIIMLSELYKNNKKSEIENYIGNIIDEIEIRDYSKSDNFVLDSIINYKLREMQGSNAIISVDVKAPQQINICPYDLTVILGNLLDNAITGMMKSKNKKISLRISCNMRNLIIIIENSYDGKLLSENGNFKTTKLFKENHGIGLVNIKKSLEKYDGEMRTKIMEEIFSVSVIIPF